VSGRWCADIMRSFVVAGVTAGLLTLSAAPASASPATSDGGWYPAPSAPFSVPAGVRCAFPIHGEPIADEVQGLNLDTYPDGSPKRAVYAGKLVVRVTNTNTSASYDADASGTAVVDYGTDGSQHWRWIGPVLVGFGATTSNHAQGMFILDGAYDMDIANGYKTVHGVGSETDVCAQID
jgi:hypothetical protein